MAKQQVESVNIDLKLNDTYTYQDKFNITVGEYYVGEHKLYFAIKDPATRSEKFYKGEIIMAEKATYTVELEGLVVDLNVDPDKIAADNTVGIFIH